MDYGKALRIARAISGLQQKDLADKAVASEPEDLTLTEPSELQEVATSLAKLLLPQTFHKDEPKPKQKVRLKSRH